MNRIDQNPFLLRMCILFLIVPYLAPNGITEVFPILGKTVWGQYTRIGCFIIILGLLVFKNLKHKRIPSSCVIFILFFGVLALITLCKGGSLSVWARYYFNPICILIAYGVFQEHIADFLWAMIYYLSILCVVNFGFVLLYPNGMYYDYTAGYNSNWLLGYKSSLQYYIVPLVVFAWIISNYSQKKTLFIALDTICVLEAILCKNAMLLIVLLVLNLFAWTRLYNVRMCNLKLYVIIAFSVNVILIFFTNQFFNMKIGKMLSSVFKKSTTLSSRATIIWPIALRVIKNNLLVGNGVLSTTQYRLLFGINSAPHSHNQVLNYLMEGGILYLSIYILIILYIIHKNKNRNCIASKCLSVGMFIILLFCAVEIMTNYIGGALWLIFVMLIDADVIDKALKKENEVYNGKKRIRIVWNKHAIRA